MKCAVKRKGFDIACMKQLAMSCKRSVYAVVCLPNESCVIGDEYPAILRNHLIRTYCKHSKTYRVSLDFRTGEVALYRSSRQREIDPCTKREILDQLKSRLWRYTDETKIEFWMEGLGDEPREEDIRSLKTER